MSSDYTGNPAATQAPSPAPGDDAEPILRLPTDGDTLNVASIWQNLKALADFAAWLTNNAIWRGISKTVTATHTWNAAQVMNGTTGDANSVISGSPTVSTRKSILGPFPTFSTILWRLMSYNSGAASSSGVELLLNATYDSGTALYTQTVNTVPSVRLRIVTSSTHPLQLHVRASGSTTWNDSSWSRFVIMDGTAAGALDVSNQVIAGAGLVATSGGAAITGNSTVAGSFATTGGSGTITSAQALTVTTGGAAITGNSTVAGSFATTGGSGTITSAQTLTVSAGNAVVSAGEVHGRHYRCTTSAPSIAAGTGAGTSPSVSISGNDHSGTITITTGTFPQASQTIATMTLNATVSWGSSIPVLYPNNAAAAALSGNAQVMAQSTGTANQWVIVAGSTNLTASTTYVWHYHVLG